MTLTEDTFEIDVETRTIRPVNNPSPVTFTQLMQYLGSLWEDEPQMDLDVTIVCLPACIPAPETVY
jgi:hypothetical protein